MNSLPSSHKMAFPPLSMIGIQAASEVACGGKIPSGIRELDTFLDGGLPSGAITEWGLPWGQGCREILLPWLRGLTNADRHADRKAGFCLWIYPHHQDLRVYPPSWQARGVNLDKMRFALSHQPLKDLRPVFLEPVFRLIVIDSPRSFTTEDCAFIARSARQHGYAVFLLRDGPLAKTKGNIWASIRINVRLSRLADGGDELEQQHELQVIRGLSPRRLKISAPYL